MANENIGSVEDLTKSVAEQVSKKLSLTLKELLPVFADTLVIKYIQQTEAIKKRETVKQNVSEKASEPIKFPSVIKTEVTKMPSIFDEKTQKLFLTHIDKIVQKVDKLNFLTANDIKPINASLQNIDTRMKDYTSQTNRLVSSLNSLDTSVNGFALLTSKILERATTNTQNFLPQSKLRNEIDIEALVVSENPTRIYPRDEMESSIVSKSPTTIYPRSIEKETDNFTNKEFIEEFTKRLYQLKLQKENEPTSMLEKLKTLQSVYVEDFSDLALKKLGLLFGIKFEELARQNAMLMGAMQAEDSSSSFTDLLGTGLGIAGGAGTVLGAGAKALMDRAKKPTTSPVTTAGNKKSLGGGQKGSKARASARGRGRGFQGSPQPSSTGGTPAPKKPGFFRPGNILKGLGKGLAVGAAEMTGSYVGMELGKKYGGKEAEEAYDKYGAGILPALHATYDLFTTGIQAGISREKANYAETMLDRQKKALEEKAQSMGFENLEDLLKKREAGEHNVGLKYDRTTGEVNTWGVDSIKSMPSDIKKPVIELPKPSTPDLSSAILQQEAAGDSLEFDNESIRDIAISSKSTSEGITSLSESFNMLSRALEKFGDSVSEMPGSTTVINQQGFTSKPNARTTELVQAGNPIIANYRRGVQLARVQPQ